MLGSSIFFFVSELLGLEQTKVIIFSRKMQAFGIFHASIVENFEKLIYTNPVPKNRKVCCSVSPDFDQELSSYRAKIRPPAQGV